MFVGGPAAPRAPASLASPPKHRASTPARCAHAHRTSRIVNPPAAGHGPPVGVSGAPGAPPISAHAAPSPLVPLRTAGAHKPIPRRSRRYCANFRQPLRNEPHDLVHAFVRRGAHEMKLDAELRKFQLRRVI